MISEKIENFLRATLQKKIRIRVNNKTLREGRLILFSVKDFYMTLMLKTDEDVVKTYEMPVPFTVRVGKNTDAVFDYTIDTITRNEVAKKILITTLYNKVGKKSKFYDNTVSIEIQ